MKLHTLLFILLFTGNILFAETIIDMTGRTVNLTNQIDKVLPYDSKTSILLFPVATGTMAAKAVVPGSKPSSAINEAYNQLPEVDIKNYEEVLIYAPTIIIAGVFIPEKNYNRYNDLQSKYGIPVVLVDLSIDKLDKTYEFLGKLLKEENKAKQLSVFLTDLYKLTDSLKTANPLSENISVYYTIGGNGLMTDPAGSKHTELMDYLGLPNAAKVALPTGGHAQVNMEQIIEWNPDYILAADFKGSQNAYNMITQNVLWSNINAIKYNQVFKIPCEPFGWFDHPPSVNRISGLIWLCHIFYGLSVEKETALLNDFFNLFYLKKGFKDDKVSILHNV